MDSVDKTQSIGKQQASLLGARIKSMITLLLLPLPCISSSNDQGGSLQPALPGVTLFQTKLGACKDPEASEKLRTPQSERVSEKGSGRLPVSPWNPLFFRPQLSLLLLLLGQFLFHSQQLS